MAKRSKLEEKPAKSNRGRLNAQGVFVIFDEAWQPSAEPDREELDEDEPLARGEGNGAHDRDRPYRLHVVSWRDGLRVTFRPAES